MTISQPRSLLLGLTLVLAACGGEGLTLPPDGAAAHIEILSGDGQSARVGEPLPDSVVVRVTDTQNRPVAGVDVVFDFTTGGSSAGPAAATNSEGITWSRLVLGTVPGPVTGKVKVPVDAGITPVEAPITALATSADANGIAQCSLPCVSGDNQTGPVGTQLPAPLVVAVTDQFGNPISGIDVQWSVTGGGSVSSIASTTDVNGRASVTRILGPTAGAQTTVATAVGLAGSPVPFNHTATAGTATTVVKIAPLVTEAPAGSVLDLVVEVRDASGNPISNAPVTWLVGEGGGSATPSSNTNSEGRATSRWTLGSTPGTNTLNVVSSGGATTTFTVTGTGTGAPSKLAVSTQPPSSVTIGTTLTPGPIVQVKDAADHDVPTAGVDISVSLASGPGTLEGTRTVTTDANGRAQFTDLRISGATGKHRLIFAADGLQSVRSITFDVVSAPNGAPTAQDDGPYTTNEDATLHIPRDGAQGWQANDSDPDGDPLTPEIVSDAPNGHVTVNADRSLDYSPNANFSGDDSFTYRVNDGRGGVSTTATVRITVSQVNDAPTFTSGGNQTASTGDGPQSRAWAGNVSSGPANESSQTVAFQVTNDNPSVFAPGGEPAVDPSGTLTFTPNPLLTESTSANISVTLADNGGTANGGDDTSQTQTFIITVSP